MFHKSFFIVLLYHFGHIRDERFESYYFFTCFFTVAFVEYWIGIKSSIYFVNVQSCLFLHEIVVDTAFKSGAATGYDGTRAAI